MDERNNSILIDSNIAIYSTDPQYESLRIWLQRKDIVVSVISKVEVLGYHKLLQEDKIYFEEFFSTCKVLPINEREILNAIELKQEKSMSLGDAIIAATAVTNSLPLMTANTRDFRHIENLGLINPLEI